MTLLNMEANIKYLEEVMLSWIGLATRRPNLCQQDTQAGEPRVDCKKISSTRLPQIAKPEYVSVVVEWEANKSVLSAFLWR